MNTHRHINSLLYEYLRNELSEADRTRVEEHAAACSHCSADLAELRAVISLLPRRAPADELPEGFWNAFPARVEEKLAKRQRGFWPEVWDEIVSFLTLRPMGAAAISTAAALVVVGIFLWQRYQVREQVHEQSPALSVPVQTVSTDARMNDYFRKSKMLLVGITNMKVGESVDLSAERKYSRELIHEARYLKSQPISGRSAQLISDLEKILIELANLKDQGDAPDVELIRGGIHQENLLFKIRVAESVYDSSRTEKERY